MTYFLHYGCYSLLALLVKGFQGSLAALSKVLNILISTLSQAKEVEVYTTQKRTKKLTATHKTMTIRNDSELPPNTSELVRTFITQMIFLIEQLTNYLTRVQGTKKKTSIEWKNKWANKNNQKLSGRIQSAPLS